MDKKIFFQAGISYAEDTIFIAKALLEAHKIYYIPLKLYIRRIRENSVTTSALDVKKVKDSFFVADKLAEIIWQYIENEKDYDDKYISIVLCHYRAAVHIQNTFESNADCISVHEKIMHMYSLISFLNRTLKIWSNGNNISNAQISLDLIAILKKNCISNTGQNHKAVRTMEEILQDVVNKHLVNKLYMLPFENENETIAIYGTGKATDLILKLYKEKIGRIACKIVFIKTVAERMNIMKAVLYIVLVIFL